MSDPPGEDEIKVVRKFLDIVYELQGAVALGLDELTPKLTDKLDPKLGNLYNLLNYLEDKLAGKGATLRIDGKVVQLTAERVVKEVEQHFIHVAGILSNVPQANMKADAQKTKTWMDEMKDVYKKSFIPIKDNIAIVIKRKEEEQNTEDIQILPVEEKPVRRAALFNDSSDEEEEEIVEKGKEDEDGEKEEDEEEQEKRVEEEKEDEEGEEEEVEKQPFRETEPENLGPQNPALPLEPRLLDVFADELAQPPTPPQYYHGFSDEESDRDDDGGPPKSQAAEISEKNHQQQFLPDNRPTASRKPSDATTGVPQQAVIGAVKRSAQNLVQPQIRFSDSSDEDEEKEEEEDDKPPPKKKERRRAKKEDAVADLPTRDDAPSNKLDNLEVLTAQRRSLKPIAAKLLLSAALPFIKDTRIAECDTLVMIAEEVKEICGASLICSLADDLPGDPSNFRGIGEDLTNLVKPEFSLDSTRQTTKSLSKDFHPRFAISAAPFLDFRTVSGQEVIAAAKRGPGVACSTNLEKTKLFSCFLKEKTLVDTEKEYIERNGVAQQPTDLTDIDEEYLPIFQFEADTLSDEELKKYSHMMGTATSFLLKNMNEACGIPLDAITFEKVFQLGGDLKIEVLRSVVQPTNSNYSYDYVNNNQKWKTIVYKHELKLSEFGKHYIDVVEILKEACQEIYEDPTQKERVLEELLEKLHSVVVPIPDIGHPDIYLALFATNLGLNRKRFKSLNELLDRLPELFRPNNKFDILHILNCKIEGLNIPQLYLKFPSGKTVFHCENGHFISLNWSFGPGEVIWYIVPPEYIGHFWEMMGKEKVKIETADKDRNLWIDPEVVLEEGIPLQKVIQKPGDLVVVGMGSPHWVQSSGFAINLSWNLGLLSETQLECAAMSHDRLTSIGVKPIIPLEPYIWERIRLEDKFGQMTPKMKALLKSMAMKSLVKSQMEIFWMKRNSDFKNFKRIYGNKNEAVKLKKVEFCFFCRTVLYNCVLIDGEGYTRCLKCYKNVREGENESMEMDDENDFENDTEDEEEDEQMGENDVDQEEKMEEEVDLEHEENMELGEAEEEAMEAVQKKHKGKRSKRMKKKSQKPEEELPKITVFIRSTDKELADRFDSLKIVP